MAFGIDYSCNVIQQEEYSYSVIRGLKCDLVHRWISHFRSTEDNILSVQAFKCQEEEHILHPLYLRPSRDVYTAIWLGKRPYSGFQLGLGGAPFCLQAYHIYV
jgi:hypothetical protein